MSDAPEPQDHSGEKPDPSPSDEPRRVLYSNLASVVVGLFVGISLASLGIGRAAVEIILPAILLCIVLLLLLLVIGYLALRWAKDMLFARAAPAARRLLKDIDRIGDSEFREKELWPLLKPLFQAVAGWLGFGASVSLVLALLTDFLLVAQVGVAQAQAD